MTSYQLSRYSACRKAFPLEIKCPTPLSMTLGLMAYPHCSLKFRRADPNYLNAPARS
jgi:hypothetical protein